jgi:hypothetical protein
MEMPAEACHILGMKKPKRPRDVSQLAKMMVDIASGDLPSDVAAKNTLAAEHGRQGGLARANSLSSEQRSSISKSAAKRRWEK